MFGYKIVSLISITGISINKAFRELERTLNNCFKCIKLHKGFFLLLYALLAHLYKKKVARRDFCSLCGHLIL